MCTNKNSAYPMKRNAVLTVVLLTVGVALFVGVALGGGYSLSISGEQSVPSWTFNVDGQSYTADSVLVTSGGGISFQASAPSDADYNVYLYDRDGNIVQQRRMEGSGSGTFTADPGPGTYLVALSADDGIQDARPVIIEGHSVDISVPSSVDQNSTVEVDISVSGSPSSVELIMGQGSPTRIEAEGSGGEYTATIDGSDFSTGSHTVYGAALSGDELTGLSSERSITVEEAETDDSSGGAGGGGGGGGAPPADDDPDATATPTETTNETATPTPTEATDETATPTTTEAPSDDDDTETATPSDDGVITPNETTETDLESDADGSLPAAVAIVALALAVGAMRLRRLG